MPPSIFLKANLYTFASVDGNCDRLIIETTGWTSSSSDQRLRKLHVLLAFVLLKPVTDVAVAASASTSGARLIREVLKL